jgi:transcription antitermination factor NusG
MELKRTYYWHAIYTKSRQEKKLASEYERSGIQYYLPLVTTLKQWSDRKKKVEEVLFKSYIFVYVSEKEYYDALNFPGAVKYVTLGGKAAKIPENQIEAIKNTINNKVEYNINTEYFKKGKQVEIIGGPLKGAKGELISVSGKNRLLIRIEEIGYSLVVNVTPDSIKVTE